MPVFNADVGALKREPRHAGGGAAEAVLAARAAGAAEAVLAARAAGAAEAARGL